MHSGGVLGGQAETWQNKRECKNRGKPKEFKSNHVYSKSFLDGQAEAWESKRKLQNLIKSKETTQNHLSWMVSGRSGRNLEKWAKVERK